MHVKNDRLRELIQFILTLGIVFFMAGVIYSGSKAFEVVEGPIKFYEDAAFLILVSFVGLVSTLLIKARFTNRN